MHFEILVLMLQISISLVVTLQLRPLRSTGRAGVEPREHVQRGETLAAYTQNKR